MLKELTPEEALQLQHFVLREVYTANLRTAVSALTSLGMPVEGIESLVHASIRTVFNVQRSGALGPKAVDSRDERKETG